MHTIETIRIRYFMDLLMEKSWPVMLVGNAGTGKSVLMGDKLDSLDSDSYLVQAVPFNFYTTSAMLQGEAGAGAGSKDVCRGARAGRRDAGVGVRARSRGAGGAEAGSRGLWAPRRLSGTAWPTCSLL